MSAATETAGVVITEPGVYDLPVESYYADPVAGGSLSCSGAKRLLPPSCPAIFDHERRNPPPPTDTLDFGSAAHRIVLGAGADLVVVEADDWRTNAAKAQKKAAHAAGLIPMLRKDYTVVVAMATQLAAHPVASRLLTQGTPEQALVWRDDETGVWRRALVDILPPVNPTGRMIVADYKTCVSANPQKVAKAAADYGYHQQHAWYVDGVAALGLDDDPAFVLVAQEKTAPYLVTVVQLDETAVRIGRLLNRRALDLYATCVADDTWPTYADGVAHVSLPAYYERAFEEYL